MIYRFMHWLFGFHYVQVEFIGNIYCVRVRIDGDGKPYVICADTRIELTDTPYYIKGWPSDTPYYIKGWPLTASRETIIGLKQEKIPT